MKTTSYQAVVAQYHVESDPPSEEDEAAAASSAHEMDGLMTSTSNGHHQKWRHPLWGESHQSFAMNAISSEDDEDQGKKKTIPVRSNFFTFDITIIEDMLDNGSIY